MLQNNLTLIFTELSLVRQTAKLMGYGSGKIVLRQGTSRFESGILKPAIFELEQKHFSYFGNTQLSRLHTKLNRRRFDNSVSPSENRAHYTNQ